MTEEPKPDTYYALFMFIAFIMGMMFAYWLRGIGY
jgi:hypothetical protein